MAVMLIAGRCWLLWSHARRGLVDFADGDYHWQVAADRRGGVRARRSPTDERPGLTDEAGLLIDAADAADLEVALRTLRRQLDQWARRRDGPP